MSDYADNLRKSAINATKRFVKMVEDVREKQNTEEIAQANNATALRLADLLQDEHVDGYVHDEAADELRRLYAQNEIMLRNLRTVTTQRDGKSNAIQRLWKERDALRTQRDELLAALRYHQEQTRPIQRSIDAIAKATGEVA